MRRPFFSPSPNKWTKIWCFSVVCFPFPSTKLVFAFTIIGLTALHYEFSSSYLKFKPQIFPFTLNNVIANSIAPKYKKLNRGKTGVAKLPNIITGHQWCLGATEVGETLSNRRLFQTVLAFKASHYLLSADIRHITKEEYVNTWNHI